MLRVRNLNACVGGTDADRVHILRNISFDVSSNEIVGMLGESGAGKSMAARAIMGLTPSAVKISYDELVTSDVKISMIFQHPTMALNPVFTIGEQMMETLLLHKLADNKTNARKAATTLLAEMGIDYPAERLNSYPHQLSGGMNQRVMIALALAASPRLLLADEPTTALDVIIQAQIIKLLMDLRYKRKLAMLFISHNIALVERIADRVIVMTAGEIVEVIDKERLARGDVRHPYTKALKECVPSLAKRGEPLATIAGRMAKNTADYANRCIFCERCPNAMDRCRREKPVLADGVACFAC
ncbi:dipeptide ABC transporter ATP-binding protein [Deferribacterales bacterium RsTz2092]|nr:peptide ABC transporter ATP-binding protein [Deferribacterales bacterium]